MRQSSTKRWFLLLALALLNACSSGSRQADKNEYLDRGTGVTVTHLAEPAVFAHAAPRLSAFGRDYLYVAPMEINRSGEREYYLWVAEWSGIDRPLGFEEALILTESAGIDMLIDGQFLQLRDIFDPDGKYRSFEDPYNAPVASARIRYFRVSRDLLRRIARAEAIVITLNSGDQQRKYDWQRGNVQSFATLLDNDWSTENNKN
jgi:hypothetical protein